MNSSRIFKMNSILGRIGCACLRHSFSLHLNSLRQVSSGVRIKSSRSPGWISSKNFSSTLVRNSASISGTGTENSSKKSQSITSPDDWKIIYRCNFIVAARAIQKIKVYQTVFSVAGIVPATTGLHLYGLMSPASYFIALGGSGFACLMLFVMGNIFGKLVGILYTSQSRPDQVKVARLNFWGNREDEYHFSDDFEPISEVEKPHDVYIKLKQYSEDKPKLYFSLQYGKIEDLEEMERIFGRLPEHYRICTPASSSSSSSKSS